MLSKWITRNLKFFETISCVTICSDKAITGFLIIYFHLVVSPQIHSLSIIKLFTEIALTEI